MTIDSHTHTSRPGAVIDIDASQLGVRNPELLPDRWYSVGIHPWNASLYTQRDLSRLRSIARNERVVAIGECGLDSLHVCYELVNNGHTTETVQARPNIKRQMELLKCQIAISEELRKPLLLHVVKLFPDIIRLHKTLRPAMPWVIHGFRGKAGLARELLRHGFYLSYGEEFNIHAVKTTPPDRMMVETDESSMPIDEIVASLPVVPTMTLPELAEKCGKI